MLWSRVLADLAPFPGRAMLTWRVALLCAIVCGAAMLYELPEAAISCYLIIYLMKPDAVMNIGTAIGLIVLVIIVVVCMIPLINVTAESPPLRMLAIAVVSFIFLFIGAASQLGETGGVIALVISFILTLVHMAPVGDALTFGLRYAAYMAIMPMLLMVGFNLFLGLSPVRLLRQTLRLRLAAAADAIESGTPYTDERLGTLLSSDNAALEKQAAFVRMLHLATPAAAAQIASDVRASYRLMFAASALPRDLDERLRASLVDAIRAADAAIEAGRMPPPPKFAAAPGSAAEVNEIEAALAVLAGAPEGPVAPVAKQPFFAADALTNPEYQRFALKTTAAAVICYIIYSGLDWQGIHTAMITCYVAALGSTGETVHKLALRISGCLVGAAMGMAAVLWAMPMLETIGGLMALVFAGVLIGAWVSSGPERISYAGVQIALAFLLVVVQGFGPTTSLSAGWDRIVGILLGNVVVYLIFTRMWPVSVESIARRRLINAIAALGRLAALTPERRKEAIPEVAQVLRDAGGIDDDLDLMEFEPQSIRLSVADQAAVRTASEEIAVLCRDIYFSQHVLPDLAEALRRIAANLTSGQTATIPAIPDGPFSDRLDRLQIAAAR
jgi:multidrug resistance protein MdtO